MSTKALGVLQPQGFLLPAGRARGFCLSPRGNKHRLKQKHHCAFQAPYAHQAVGVLLLEK